MPGTSLTPAKAARRALVAKMRKEREAGIAIRKKRRLRAVKQAGEEVSAIRTESRTQLSSAHKGLSETSKNRAKNREALKAQLSLDGKTRKKDVKTELRSAGQSRRQRGIADRKSRISAFHKLVSEVPGSED